MTGFLDEGFLCYRYRLSIKLHGCSLKVHNLELEKSSLFSKVMGICRQVLVRYMNTKFSAPGCAPSFSDSQVEL